MVHIVVCVCVFLCIWCFLRFVGIVILVDVFCRLFCIREDYGSHCPSEGVLFVWLCRFVSFGDAHVKVVRYIAKLHTTTTTGCVFDLLFRTYR